MQANFSNSYFLGEILEVPKGLDLEVRWTIKDFLSSPNPFESNRISPSFSFEGVVWRLDYYPRIKYNDSSDNFAVSLSRDEIDPPISQEYSVAIETRDRQKCHELYGKVFGDTLRDRRPAPISRSELQKRESEYLPSGVLTLVCTMKSKRSVENGGTNIAPVFSTQCPKNKIIGDMEQMLLKRQQTDVVIEVDDRTNRPIRTYHAHMHILAERSSVFAYIFQYDKTFKETGKVVIGDCDTNSFGDFLCFLYIGDEDSLTDDNAFSLFTTATKFKTFDLKALCLERIKRNLSVDTFCEAVSSGIQHSESELIRFTADFFVKNALKILVTPK